MPPHDDRSHEPAPPSLRRGPSNDTTRRSLTDDVSFDAHTRNTPSVVVPSGSTNHTSTVTSSPTENSDRLPLVDGLHTSNRTAGRDDVTSICDDDHSDQFRTPLSTIQCDSQPTPNEVVSDEPASHDRLSSYSTVTVTLPFAGRLGSRTTVGEAHTDVDDADHSSQDHADDQPSSSP
jgi:hypothetical protein